MQKKIIRAIVGTKYNTHTSDIFHHLRILMLEDIHKLHVGKYILSYMKNYLPTPLLKMYPLASANES